MAKNRPEIRLLLRLLDQAYDRKAWHGPNLRGSLRGVSARQANWRPATNRHSIRELALHAAYWKYAARRRLVGDKRGTFPISGSDWFDRPPTGEQGWKSDLKLLESTHRALRTAVSKLNERALRRKPRGSTVLTVDLLLGVAAHDLYHAGQIQLLKRLSRRRARV